ncbi:uncharacterized protein [Clinocottus analis]|uniref:uncharacterized protein n=1 Tax=Clinocottus analis TaxID=304258 RepID=UPI0035BF2AB1
MHLFSLLLFLSLGALVKFVSAADSDWCYTGCEHTPSHWANIPGVSCGEKRQSPIDIVTSNVQIDPHLLNFTFVNFSSKHAIKSINNTGHTVKCTLEDHQVEVSGGGLDGTYSTLQFHFHWGKTEHHPGAEHTIDGHRYPMEMHIVSLKKGFSIQSALQESEGLAVLGFFINATDDGDMSGPWAQLTSNLTNLTEVDVKKNISINDLIGNVDLTKFFRYMGSLTTPNCSEAVVWTVFQQPININKKLVQRFLTDTGLMNVYRPTQPLNGRDVFASPATSLPPSHSWCYEDEACDYKPSHWHILPHSYCDGKRQSPINIDTGNTVTDKHLGAFIFTKFDDKHAIKYITNTGHSVKCVLHEDMVEVSGGGLGYVYSALQFHFHWGSNKSDGSEHNVDSKRYPMEMHIVSKRKDLTLEKAIETPNGLAVLGFLIEAKNADSHSSEQETHSTSDMEAWKKMTSYLSAIHKINSKVNVTEEISIDDLLGDVNRAEYYRYNGSLTTPSCNEAVVWTVFKEPVKVDQDLINMFPTHAGYHNVYRPTQPLNNRKIYTTSASSAPVPIILLLLLACLCSFSHVYQEEDD